MYLCIDHVCCLCHVPPHGKFGLMLDLKGIHTMGKGQAAITIGSSLINARMPLCSPCSCLLQFIAFYRIAQFLLFLTPAGPFNHKYSLPSSPKPSSAKTDNRCPFYLESLITRLCRLDSFSNQFITYPTFSMRSVVRFFVAAR
jgi:hypothetical protein